LKLTPDLDREMDMKMRTRTRTRTRTKKKMVWNIEAYQSLDVCHSVLAAYKVVLRGCLSLFTSLETFPYKLRTTDESLSEPPLARLGDLKGTSITISW